MLFNSLQFALFLPIVFALYWALPHKFRWLILLIASCWFYMSGNAKYIIFLATATLISYTSAILMEKQESIKKKKLILAVAAVLCLGVLFMLKYFNFFSTSLSKMCSAFSIKLQPTTLKLLLPVGLSFYTFQTVGYLIDVYRGKIKAEHHLGYYALFVSFFPQISSGPIGRAPDLLPQYKAEKNFDYSTAVYGLRLMLWGFFKKLVVADNLAYYVDMVYTDLPNKQGFCLVLAAFFYSIQIYCDFSGYTDIARGTAKLFGINLMENFKSPYYSSSIREFWSRWHISLSTWFRDYVYIPLGGNRVSRFRNSLNLMVTFLLSGLWHGADWSFLLWGGVHGLAQVAEKRLTGPPNANGKNRFTALKTICVFVFATLAWVFFRADSVKDAFYVFSHALNGISDMRTYIGSGMLNIGLDKVTLLWKSFLYFVPIALFDAFSLKTDLISGMSRLKAYQRHGIYIVLIILITVFHAYGNTSFVYFQF